MISERLKVIRKIFGKSQKAFATELGLSLSGLQGYEAGTFAPGYAVLETLCRNGIDANWLFTGEGPMWRAGCEPDATVVDSSGAVQRELKARELPPSKRPTADSIRQVALYEQDDVWKRLDFGVVALLASQGRQTLSWYILTFLVSHYPIGFCVADMFKALEHRELSFTPRDVAAQITAMVMQGLVAEEVEDGATLYRAASHYARLLMSNVGDRSQALEKAVESLIRDVWPGTESRPENEPSPGRLMNIKLSLPAGKGIPFLRGLTDLIAQKCIEAGKEDGPDLVVVVVGAAPAGERP